MEVVCVDDSGQPFLAGSRCIRCGFTAFPQQVVCPHCLEPSMTPMPVGQTGILRTRTIARFAPVPFQPGYAFGFVDTEEGFRVFSHLEGDYGSLPPGSAMELCIKNVASTGGSDRLVPCYRLMHREGAEG